MDARSKRKKLSLIVVKDSNVHRFVTDIKEKQARLLRECHQNQQAHSSQSSDGPSYELPPLKEEDDTELEADILSKPTELHEDEHSVKGSRIFGFSTPSKKVSMLERAEYVKKSHGSPATPKTPSTPKTINLRDLEGSRTPKTPRSSSKYVVTTPKRKRSSSEEPATPKTPYTLRKRVKQRIKKIVYEEESSSEEEDSNSDNHSFTSESDDSEEDKENGDTVTPNKTSRRESSRFDKGFTRTSSKKWSTTPLKGTPIRTPSGNGYGKRLKDVEMVARAEDYFIHQKDSKRIMTSNHTLNHLQTPRLSPEDLHLLLSSTILSHQEERKNLLENHLYLFSQWMTFLCENFSIFLYGLGSKKALINVFQQQYLENFDHIVINGFFPSLTLKSILNTITENILEYTGRFGSYQDQVEYILNAYSKEEAEPLFIIIHNLDGPMLRMEKTQKSLAQLASLPSVHLLASIDHINAPLILDSEKMSSYNALWYDATTFSPYTEETSYENSLLLNQSGALALSSLIHVFRSLTPNAKGIFLLLAKYQLDQKDNSNYAGLSFGDMYQRCRDSFLVNSDLTLRAQLTEFKDHKLIRVKKGVDGIENLLIPLDSSTLQDFISQEEQCC